MRGVFQVRAAFGYTVMVDGVTIPLDLSWTDANQLTTFIAALRFEGDGRGAARCRHEGNEACFKAEQCLQVQGPLNRGGRPRTRPWINFHFDNRPADYWHTYEDEHDPGDEDTKR